MALLNKKIKSSTLIETLVSMVIIMFGFSIALQIIINVFRSDNYYSKLNAFTTIKSVEADCKKNNRYFDEKLNYENMDVYKSIKQYNTDKELQILLIEAFDKKGSKLAEHKELIIL
ncbi:MAG: hypothetical protein WC223_10940 [Bacteroidales bacterium]|jgi:hypothetical protein